MAKGAHGQYNIKGQTVETFLSVYQDVLTANKFAEKDVDRDGETVKHRAIFGDKKKSFFRSLLPFGSMEEEGNRYGAEMEMRQENDDLSLNLLVVPYMTLLDVQDRFLISQGLFEKYIDDDWCTAKLGVIIDQLKALGLQIEERTD